MKQLIKTLLVCPAMPSEKIIALSGVNHLNLFFSLKQIEKKLNDQFQKEYRKIRGRCRCLPLTPEAISYR